jgi:dihydrolipoamide dehydrogenase
LAIAHDMNAEDIINTIHAHPTLGEAFSEAVSGLRNEAIHMMPAKKI